MKKRYRAMLHAIARLLARDDERPPRDEQQAERMLAEATDAPWSSRELERVADHGIDRAIAEELDPEPPPPHSRLRATALTGVGVVAVAAVTWFVAGEIRSRVSVLPYEEAVRVTKDTTQPFSVRRSAAASVSQHGTNALERLRALHDDPVLGHELPDVLERLQRSMEDPSATGATSEPIGRLHDLLANVLDRHRDIAERSLDLLQLGTTLQSGVGALQALEHVDTEANPAHELLQRLQRAVEAASSRPRVSERPA